MNSMGDAGTVLLGGIWLMWITHNKNILIFKQWKWSAIFCFIVMVRKPEHFCRNVFVL